MFAIHGAKRMYVRGNKAFEAVSEKIGLQNITAGKICKLAATNSSFTKDPRQRKLLSSVLVHDMSTHSRVYEEHMCTSITQFCHVPALLDYFETGACDYQIMTSLPPTDGERARGNDQRLRPSQAAVVESTQKPGNEQLTGPSQAAAVVGVEGKQQRPPPLQARVVEREELSSMKRATVPAK